MNKIWVIILLFVCVQAQDTSPGLPIGQPAKEWIVKDWINSDPLTLEKLRGKVVLVRWWTGPACPYCSGSAPALNEFHESYTDDGLTVIGFYHHKSRKPLTIESVKKMAGDLGFTFPVAIDYDWKTLTEWWLRDHSRGWTSVTFLLDREGIIRHIHPGGKYVQGDGDYTKLKQAIESLLAEGKD